MQRHRGLCGFVAFIGNTTFIFKRLLLLQRVRCINRQYCLHIVGLVNFEHDDIRTKKYLHVKKETLVNMPNVLDALNKTFTLERMLVLRPLQRMVINDLKKHLRASSYVNTGVELN